MHKRAAAREHLLRNPNASNADVIAAIHVSPETVNSARRELAEAGYTQIPRGRKFRVPATPSEGIEVKPLPIPESASLPDPVPVADLIDAIDDQRKRVPAVGDHLDTEEMRRILSRIARDLTQPSTVRIAAITAKQKLDFEQQDRHSLGPGEPITKESAALRLSLLMKACGFAITRTAIALAFAKDIPDDQVPAREAPAQAALDSDSAAPPEDGGRGALGQQAPNDLPEPSTRGSLGDADPRTPALGASGGDEDLEPAVGGDPDPRAGGHDSALGEPSPGPLRVVDDASEAP